VHAHYFYGAAGQRVKKLVRKQGGNYETTVYIDGLFEHHSWKEGSEPMQENNRLHVMDDQRRIAIIRVGEKPPEDKGPAVQYHLGDHLGSGSLVVDNSGDWINREEYTPYGETSFGSFARKRYRFTGKERDEESGLYYHGARYYAPWLSKWVSCDPAGMVDGLDLYIYVTDNPLRLVDTYGTQYEDAPPPPEPTVEMVPDPDNPGREIPNITVVGMIIEAAPSPPSSGAGAPATGEQPYSPIELWTGSSAQQSMMPTPIGPVYFPPPPGPPGPMIEPTPPGLRGPMIEPTPPGLRGPMIEPTPPGLRGPMLFPPAVNLGLAYLFLLGNAIFTVGPDIDTEYVEQHEHHIFPQEYREIFEEFGIDIDQWVITVDPVAHGMLHRGNEKHLPWNEEWGYALEDILEAYLDGRISREQAAGLIMEKGAEMFEERKGIRHLPLHPYGVTPSEPIPLHQGPLKGKNLTTGR
jgi:RHS repeat-associated protein